MNCLRNRLSSDAMNFRRSSVRREEQVPGQGEGRRSAHGSAPGQLMSGPLDCRTAKSSSLERVEMPKEVLLARPRPRSGIHREVSDAVVG